MATRFYHHEAGTAPITPAVGTGWATTLASFARRPMHTTARLSDALATVAMTAPTVGTVQCWRQYIGRPMAAGNAFTTSTTFKAYAQVLESAINDNLFARCGVRILSEDGATVRATLLSVADYSTATEFNTALRNKAFINGDASAANYTTVDGDRLVFECGATDAAGASILGSIRLGSTDAAISDLPEDETTTTTTMRPWFECSLNITFKTPTEEVRYVNTASTTGGDGTTNGTAGSTRAFATMADLVASAWWATDFPTANKRATINFSGTAADANAADVFSGTRQSAPDCYYNLVCDSPSSLQYSTSYYRMEPSAKGVHLFQNNGILYFRMTGFQFKANAPDSGGYLGFNPCGVTTLEPGDIRLDRFCFTEVLNNTATGSPFGLGSLSASPNIKVTVTNSVAFDFKGTGSTHTAYKKPSACTIDIAFVNCLAYNSTNGFFSESNNALAVNCNAQSCTDGFVGTWAAGSTNNASDITSDAPATNRQTGTTTFVSAGSDFHLSSSDTVCKDHGADQSADARYAFSTDGDGETRTGTWDIGPDEIVGTIATAIKAAAAAAAIAASVTLGSLSAVSTVSPASAAGKAGSTVSLGALTPVATVAPAAAVGTTGAIVSLGTTTPVATSAPAAAAGLGGSTVSVGGITSISTVAPAAAVAPVATPGLGALSLPGTVGPATSVAFSAVVDQSFLAGGTVAPVSAAGIAGTSSLGALSVIATNGPASAIAPVGASSLGALTVTATKGPSSAIANVGTVSMGAFTAIGVAAPAAANALVATTSSIIAVLAVVAPASALGRVATADLSIAVLAVVAQSAATATIAAVVVGGITIIAVAANAASAAPPAALIVDSIDVAALVAGALALSPSAIAIVGDLTVMAIVAQNVANAYAATVPAEGTVTAVVASAVAAATIGLTSIGPLTVAATVAAAFAEATIATILLAEPPGRVLRALADVYPALRAIPVIAARLAADLNITAALGADATLYQDDV